MSADEKNLLKELREITRNKDSWKENLEYVASFIDRDYSVSVKAKSLWLIGEMGLKYPSEMEKHLPDIFSYLEDDEDKLRERSVNALGRIGRGDNNLIIGHIDRLMKMKDDKSENVRHAFIWACENIAAEAPELFCQDLEIFYEMFGDSSEKVRIEAPEIFRVVGKRKPSCVKPYLKRLEKIAKDDEHPVVRIHAEGAIRMTRKALKEN